MPSPLLVCLCIPSVLAVFKLATLKHLTFINGRRTECHGVCLQEHQGPQGKKSDFTERWDDTGILQHILLPNKMKNMKR